MHVFEGVAAEPKRHHIPHKVILEASKAPPHLSHFSEGIHHAHVHALEFLVIAPCVVASAHRFPQIIVIDYRNCKGWINIQ